MTNYAMPVSLYMSSPVYTVSPDAELAEAQDELRTHGISSLAVTEGDRMVGVVSRTDLLRVGRMQAGATGKAALLTLPSRKVREVMRAEVIAVSSEDAVSEAAKRMVKDRIHRVFVIDGEKLVGLLSTKDVMTAIKDKRDTHLLSEYMSAPVFSVRATEPVSLATDRLAKAHVTGLVVVDEDEWPVGVFTQLEALTSKDAPAETPVEDVMNPAMLCLRVDTPLHRAAAQASALRVRRVLCVEDRRIRGILTGIDFARAVC